MNIETICVHGNRKNYDNTGAISVPIFQSATFFHPQVGESTGFDYSRLKNPTREHLEITMARLEGGAAALAFSSGMAAEACLFGLFGAGDHIIASTDLYGGTRRLFDTICAKNGISFTFLDTGDANEVAAAIRPNTAAIFVETPTNPMMQITDIAAIAAIKPANALLIVDNTFLTPYLQRPIELGADAVIHSATKYLGGHNDVLAGIIVAKTQELAERLRAIQITTGAVLSPMDSWLTIRGIKTLAVRMEKSQATARVLANWLGHHPKISKVNYPGAGAMISFEVDSADTAIRALNGIRLIYFAESLGGVESLLTYPYMQTHGDVPEETRLKLGINDRLLRFSVGLENSEDLINDLNHALA
ncbi:MAG: PLP-dependent transferase [Defluviitaleaceae bacterium]|nr:PLP-dependent transferase [Defluviitaleaceae bacterium]